MSESSFSRSVFRRLTARRSSYPAAVSVVSSEKAASMRKRRISFRLLNRTPHKEASQLLLSNASSRSELEHLEQRRIEMPTSRRNTKNSFPSPKSPQEYTPKRPARRSKPSPPTPHKSFGKGGGPGERTLFFTRVSRPRASSRSSAPSSLLLSHRPAGISHYWRLANDGLARRNPPRPFLVDVWITALAAKNIPYRLVSRKGNLLLYVPALLEVAARRELAAITAETCRPKPLSTPVPTFGNAHWVMGFLLLLILWHGIRMHWWTELPRISSAMWVEHGSLDVFRVRILHEWYRCVTALTLHADSEHLFGNILFGAPFLILLCRRTGLGVGLLLVVLSGALGNAFNALYRPLGHDSLGFSTALFGTVGSLSSIMAFQGENQYGSIPTWKRGLLLLAAGAAVLAMLGTEGARTDYIAHLCGLIAGFLVGGLAALALRRYGPLSARRQWLFGLAALAILVISWSLAL